MDYQNHSHVYQTPQSQEKPSTDWLWLERYLPYNEEAEHTPHWFIRFSRI